MSLGDSSWKEQCTPIEPLKGHNNAISYVGKTNQLFLKNKKNQIFLKYVSSKAWWNFIHLTIKYKSLKKT